MICVAALIVYLVHHADAFTVNIDDLTEVLNVELNKVFTWLCSNELSLEICKLTFIVFMNKIILHLYSK